MAVNTTIKIGSSYDASKFALGDKVNDSFVELLPKLTSNQRASLSPSLSVANNGFKVYDSDDKVRYIWNSDGWVAQHEIAASGLYVNTELDPDIIVDTSHTTQPTAGQVLTATSPTTAHWANPTGGGGGGTDTYTNATPTPVTIGGITSGRTFSAASMQAMWDSLLYPYQAPSFSAFSISGQGTTLEVGATSNVNPSFTWSASNTGNINTNSINISDTTAGVALVTGHSITSPASVTRAGVTKSTAGSETYQIVGTNTQSNTFNRSFTISWLWRLYYGESATTPLTASNIQALRVGNLAGGFGGTYSFSAAASQYKYICYPSSMGTATVFKDQSTNLVVPFDPAYTVSVTNSFGVNTNYNVHKSVNMIGGALTVVVS